MSTVRSDLALLDWPEALLDFGTIDFQANMAMLREATAQWTPEVAKRNHLGALRRLDWRWRFKAIAHIVNFDELGLPSWLKGYNAKPVLIQKSGAVHVGPDFLEMDVDIRGWSILSKQGLFTLFPHFKDILVEIGFVIEGRDDDEMPEARARARARLALPRPRRARASLRRRAPSLLRPTPIQAMLGCNLFNIDPTTVRPIGAVGPDDMSGKAEC